jgi:hypothetical protein
MKNSSTKRLTLIRAAVLLLATALCVVFGACAKTPDKPVPTEAPQDATEVPAPTDTPVPTEAPTAAPTPEPTPNPYEGMPVPYFDLAFDKGVAYDARDINELEVYGGEVGDVTVNFGGSDVTVTGFRGTTGDDFIKVLLDEYASDFPAFVEEGVSYEIFIQIDQIPASSGGLLISNGNGGGTNLAIRGSQGQVNFNVGSTQQDGTYSGSGYIYAQPTEASEGKKIEAGKLVHLVGIYDPGEAKVSLYYDGELASQGEFGEGDFKMAGTKSGALGIAYNASFTTECLGNLTPFTIVKARVYRQPLTAEEVKTVYENCVKLVSPSESK